MRTINPHFAIAIQEYQSGHFDKPALATRHRVSLSTIHNWNPEGKGVEKIARTPAA